MTTSINIKPSLQGLAGRLAAETFAVLRLGLGTTSLVPAHPGWEMQAGGGNDWIQFLSRGFAFFEMAAIMGKLATAAELHYYGGNRRSSWGITPSLAFVNATTLHDDSLVAADFNTIGTTLLALITFYDDFTDGWHTAAFNSLGLTLVQAAVDVGGVFKLGTRDYTYDILGGEVHPGSSSDTAHMWIPAASYDPNCCYLEVTYKNKVPAFMGDIHVGQLMYRHAESLPAY